MGGRILLHGAAAECNPVCNGPGPDVDILKAKHINAPSLTGGALFFAVNCTDLLDRPAFFILSACCLVHSNGTGAGTQ